MSYTLTYNQTHNGETHLFKIENLSKEEAEDWALQLDFHQEILEIRNETPEDPAPFYWNIHIEEIK